MRAYHDGTRVSPVRVELENRVGVGWVVQTEEVVTKIALDGIL